MKRLFLFMTLVALLGSAQPPKKFATRKPGDEFIGAWKLISLERRNATGEVTYPMGQNPVGRIAYDALGRMSVQIMRPDRPKFQAASMNGGTPEEKIAAFDGYIAYYGTYSVSEGDHVMIHHVEASSYPNWVGTDQRRLYEFSGDQLILRAVNGSGGPGTESRLVWERAR
jgi:lipocalin-like protein